MLRSCRSLIIREGQELAVSRLTGALHEHDLLCAGRSGLALITALQTESK